MSTELKATAKAKNPLAVSFVPSRSRLLQCSSADHAGPATAPPIVHEVLRSQGQPLVPETRAFMEPRFGHDFSRVRVHTDARAVESAYSINALAYALGEHIVFDTGQYAPGTAQGKKLLAHELAHTVQQGHHSGHLHQLKIGSIDSKYERDANYFESQILNGSISKAKLYQNHESLNGVIQRSFLNPFSGARIRFNDCTRNQLDDYAIIPETGSIMTMGPTLRSGVWIPNTDGFWFRHRSPRTQWFKVPNHCDVEIHCRGDNFTSNPRCNPQFSLIGGLPRWESQPQGSTTNPF